MGFVEYLTDSLGLSEVDALTKGHQSRVVRAIGRDGGALRLQTGTKSGYAMPVGLAG